MPSASKAALQEVIRGRASLSSVLYIDGWKGDDGLKQGFVHETVNHLQEYVRGEVPTQGIENFWSLPMFVFDQDARCAAKQDQWQR